MAMNSLPYFTRGEVVRGFGRGSKDLGIPTANYPEEVVDGLPEDIKCGVYYGWAKVDNGWAKVDDGSVHKMVMSIGWNPQYENIKKSMETHILHEFPNDFYGANLQICITGFIREQTKFNSIDELILAIKSDIDIAKNKLSLDDIERQQLSSYFN